MPAQFVLQQSVYLPWSVDRGLSVAIEEQLLVLAVVLA
jgi:hypothetical protein